MPPRNPEQQATAVRDASEQSAGHAGERPAAEPARRAAQQQPTDGTPKQQAGGKPKQREYRPDIQGLRALAVGMVVFYHLYPSLMTGGFAGVDVFFVISGFLITGHMLREYRKAGRIGLLEFWGRRAKRLVPAAALVLTVTWAPPACCCPRRGWRTPPSRSRRARSTTRTGSSHGTRSTTSSRTARRARCSISGRSPSRSSSTWAGRSCSSSRRSLALSVRRRPRHSRESIEEARRTRGHHVLILLASAAVAGSLWYSVYYTRVNPSGAYFVTTTRIWELGVGGLIALLPERLGRGSAGSACSAGPASAW